MTGKGLMDDAEARSRLRVGVLGPVWARLNGRELEVGGPRQRAVLAVLAVRAGRVVSRGELIDAVWGDAPPASAESGVHSYVSGLRRALEPSRAPRAAGSVLTKVGPGYLLRLEPAGLDADVFGQRLAEARRLRAAGESAGSAGTYAGALGLWRGTALSGIPGPFAETQRVRLEEARLAAAEEHADVRLELGQDGQLAGELAALVRAHPLRERLRGLLMLALYRCGRQADALTCFREARRVLAGELGVEPGPELQRLHQQILAADPALTRPAVAAGARRSRKDTEAWARSPDVEAAAGTGATGAGAGLAGTPPAPQTTEPGTAAGRKMATPLGRAGPAQLPHDVQAFTGRERELADLHAHMPEAGDPGGRPVVITAIEGTAGAGKTALAIRFAHQVAGSFPDGQLWLNLRGFAPDQVPLAPGDALGHLLHSLGMSAQQIPPGTDEKAARYRELLAARRALIVLDNAASTAQVRPLLPGQGPSLVLVTSRKQLTGLVTEDGARRIELGLLTPLEASALLAAAVDAGRVAAEPASVADLARLCGHLPLALRIAAQRIASRPHLKLADLAGELAAERDRLDVLADDAEVPAVRAAFSWSYQALPPDAARLFRLLGLHPGPDISLPAAAVLARTTAAQAQRPLDALARAHLLQETRPGRYQLHDLLRVYAAERAAADEPEAEREAAVRRLLGWYLHTTHAAAIIFRPGRRVLPLDPPEAAWPPLGFAGHAEALAWYEAEHANLTAAVRLAAETGEDVLAWKLSLSLHPFFALRRYWGECVAAHETGLAAARRLGDWEAEALELGALGVAYAPQGNEERALDCHRQALAIDTESENTRGISANLNDIGSIHFFRQRYEQAAGYFQRAVAAAREAGSRNLEGMALSNLGEAYRELGRPGPAIGHLRLAQAIFDELGDKYGLSETAHQLGETYRRSGRPEDALEQFRQALESQTEIDNRPGQARTLASLAEVLHDEGRGPEAQEALEQALLILEDLQDPEAVKVRERLGAMTGQGIDAAALGGSGAASPIRTRSGRPPG